MRITPSPDHPIIHRPPPAIAAPSLALFEVALFHGYLVFDLDFLILPA
ncbi:MAG: hypothetical protein WEB58_18650 [Planctomycetaceae bacterium]